MAPSRDVGEQLLDLKRQLENEKTRQSELQGELNSALAQLKDEFKAKTIKEAEKQLEELQQEISAHEKQIREKREEAEQLFEKGGED